MIAGCEVPRPIRPELVLPDPHRGMLANPDTLSRTLTPPTTTGESGDRSEAPPPTLRPAGWVLYKRVCCTNRDKPLGFIVGTELLHKISGSSSGQLHEVLDDIEQAPGSGMGGSYAGEQIQTVLDALSDEKSPEGRKDIILNNRDLLTDLSPHKISSLHQFAVTARLRSIRRQREAEGKEGKELDIDPKDIKRIKAEELEKVKAAAETPIGVMRSTIDLLIDAMLRNGLYTEPEKGALVLNHFIAEFIKLMEKRGWLGEADANDLRVEMGISGGED